MFAGLNSQKNRVYSLLLLVAVAVVLLSPGIGQVSGITGKDEYLLSLRTPLTMVEQDKWLVPWLDGAPRLKKPPMLYWLAGASFQLFGPSLVSARLLGVVFATLLILMTALIAWELSAGRRYGLFASLVALSTLAIAVEGRRLMLDVPCAAFSALAFYFFLRWRKRPSLSTMALSALFLSAGFLTKGPLVFMLFGSGVLALLITQAGFRRQLWLYKLHVAGFFALFLMLTAPWFIYVHLTYPEYANAMLAEDVRARQLFTFSSTPVTAVILISLPWSFVLLKMLAGVKRLPSQLPDLGGLLPFLALWLLLSVLPFFFLKSFARYMAGSMVPIALLCALSMQLARTESLRLMSRLGMLLAFMLVLLLCGFAWWFKTAELILVLTLLALSYFAVTWWQGRDLLAMAASSALLWMMLLGFLCPTLGINAIPEDIYRRVAGRDVILFKGPQPALLPIVMGRSYRRTKRIEPRDLRTTDGELPLIFAPAEDVPELEVNLHELGVRYEPTGRYQTLSSRRTWFKFAKKGATAADWRRAFETRSLDPIKSTVVLYGPVEPY